MPAAEPRGVVCRECGYESWCPTCHSLSKADYREYRDHNEYKTRIIKGALVGLLEERYTSIPQTTITLGIFFLCTGFQYVWLQLTKTPEECYENFLCETLGRRYNVKNWNAVLSNAVYLVVGGFLLVFIRVKARRDELKWRKEQRSAWEKMAFPWKDLEAVRRRGQDLDALKRQMKEHLDERLSHNKARAGLAANACLALIFEGFLSGLYHACPTPTNTQFDYIGITMVSISFFIMVWCKRHPFALSSGAYAVFFAFICLVITLDNVGFETKVTGFSTAAWVLTLTAWLILVPRFFMLLHFGIPNVIPNSHERGHIRELLCGQERDAEQVTPVAGSASLAVDAGEGSGSSQGPEGTSCCRHCCWMYAPLLGIWMLGTALLLKMFLEKPTENLSRAIMKVSIVFLGLYTTWHLFCLVWYYGKIGFSWICCCCNFDGQGKTGLGDAEHVAVEYNSGKVEPGQEKVDPGKEEDKVEIPKPVFLFILLTFAFGAAGIRFFTQDVYNTKKPMHESAAMNKECSLFGFFDNHDVWHLFSGLALGCFILTSILLDNVSGLEKVF